MALLKRLLFMALLSMSFAAHALIPKVYVTLYTMGGGWPKYSTPEAVCEYGYDASAASCKRQGGGLGSAVYQIQEFQCPANSHEASLTCACNTGFVEGDDGLSCKAEEDPCGMLADMCTGSKNFSKPFSMSGFRAGVSIVCMPATDVTGTISALPNCTKGCMGVVQGTNEFNRKSDGSWVTHGTASVAGSTCDPSVIEQLNEEKDPEYEPTPDPKTTDTPDPTCMNGQKGEVQGVSVCLPFSASSGVTEMEEKDNGDGTKTKSKTEVKCEDGKCEITKSSTTTNNTTNNTVSSSSVTTTVDKAAYCAQNKTAGVCKDEQGDEEGKGKFGGSCDAGFECKGDAVMCAMAKEQHKRACDTLEPVKDENSLWKKIEAGTDGESAKAMQARATEINITTQLDKTGYGWPRSCPANARIDLNFVPGYFEIPFFQICPPLQIFSFIALAITALSLLVWLIFAGREKAGS